MKKSIFTIVVCIILFSFPENGFGGNILKGERQTLRVAAIQMKVDLEIYKSVQSFEKKIDTLMAEAAQYSPDLVVFPEYIGLFLIFLDHYDKIKNYRGHRGIRVKSGGSKTKKAQR